MQDDMSNSDKNNTIDLNIIIEYIKDLTHGLQYNTKNECIEYNNYIT